MIATLRIHSSHEELFAERYQRLLRWSMQLTGNERDLAEDLLHDAYVQFTFTQPDIGAIKNLDGYFYTMLRNLHVSHVRRETREHWQQLSVIEFDSAEDGLRTADLRDQLRVQDELRRVSNYVCARKETTRAASVLILRFFHGYYPSEIVSLLRTSRQAVDVQLLIARREARLSFENPGALSVIGSEQVPEVFPAVAVRPTDDFLQELRQAIFKSSRGACLSGKQLCGLYADANREAIECAQLAHLVSCPSCLDEVNRMLGLPLLSERNPTETLGRDQRPKGPGGPGGGGSKGGGAGVGSWRRRARRVFEHKPQALCVAVNGYVQASQPVSSELSELDLNVDLSEQISFVEVFSDQRLRLLLLNVEELPPAGPGEHAQLIEMSDGRTLSLKLEFRSPWPTLHVAYHDPTFKEVQELLDTAASADALPVVLPSPVEEEPLRASHRGNFQTVMARLANLFGAGFWLRPGTITALFALILLASSALVYWRTTTPAVTAAGLLERAVVAEEMVATRTDQVLHRTINLEERSVGEVANLSHDTQLISRRRLELWESGAQKIKALRVYDEQSHLVRGEWTRGDGSRTVYNHTTKLRSEPARKVSAASLTFNDVWEMRLSAAEFSALIRSTDSTRVEESPNEYTVTYRNDSTADGLKSAVLVLRRPELRAIRQTLVIRQGSELREYRFSESTFEQRATSSVPPAVFEPDPELLSSTEPETRNPKLETNSPLALSPLPRAASPELEVEVLRLLNQASALSGEQIGITRTPEGQLRVQGIVDTETRKREILNTLAPVVKNPAVSIEILTPAEAANRRQSKSSSSTDSIQIEGNTVARDTIPVDAELRQYFSRQGISGAQVDEEIRRISQRMMNRSRQLRRHALALKQIVERFSVADLQTLDPDARAKWRAMIVDHARAFQQDAAALQRDLEAIFPAAPSAGGASDSEISNDRELAQAIARLYQLAAACDENVRVSFSISSAGQGGSLVESAAFWRALKSSEQLAVKISRQ